jgi:hypothetical protein
MKYLLALLFIVPSFSSFAGSGIEAMQIVLEQVEVQKLENDLRAQGYTLTRVVDVYATRGVAPRCPCTSLEMTFGKARSGTTSAKTYLVAAQGFGTRPQITIRPMNPDEVSK